MNVRLSKELLKYEIPKRLLQKIHLLFFVKYYIKPQSSQVYLYFVSSSG